MRLKLFYLMSLWALLLLNTPILLAENPPPDIFLTPKTQDNPFFGAASQHKGNPDSLEKIKIRYLLAAVRKSPLTFVRNGESYKGPRASAHLLRKYLRDEKPKAIQTARDFIEKIASHSNKTKRPYLVIDSENKIYPVRDILYNELDHLEQSLAGIKSPFKNTPAVIQQTESERNSAGNFSGL